MSAINSIKNSKGALSAVLRNRRPAGRRRQALGLSGLAGWLAGWRGQALGLRRLAGRPAGWRRQALGLGRLAGWLGGWEDKH